MSEEPVTSGGDVRALLSRGSIYTVATAFQALAGVLVLPAVTRLLSPSDYGQVATALVILQILTYVVTLGLPSAITLEYFDRRGGVEAARALLVVSMVISLTITALVDLLGPWWSENLLNDFEYDLPLRLAVWTSAPTALLLGVQALLRSQDRVKAFVLVAVLGTAGAQLLGLVLVAGTQSASAFLVGIMAGVTLASSVGLVFTGLGFTRLGERRLLVAAVQLGLPTVPHALAIYVVSAGDRLILQRELGFESVARYQVAYLVGTLGLTLVSALNNAWAPLVYGAPDTRRWAVLADTSAAVHQLMSVVIAGIAVGAPLALPALAPPAYRPTELGAVSAVVALSTLPYIGYISNAHAIFYCRRAWSLAWATPLSAILNILLNLVLIPPFGLLGSAYATVLAYALQWLLADRIRWRLAAVPWRRDVERRGWAIGIVAVLASALAPVDGLWLGIRATVVGLLFIVFSRRFRAFVAVR